MKTQNKILVIASMYLSIGSAFAGLSLGGVQVKTVDGKLQVPNVAVTGALMTGNVNSAMLPGSPSKVVGACGTQVMALNKTSTGIAVSCNDSSTRAAAPKVVTTTPVTSIKLNPTPKISTSNSIKLK